MVATGIVRRIDNLGRVVIPKEIRRTMRINEGDELEIFTSNNQVIFQKYSVIGNISAIAKNMLEALYRAHKMPVIACDKEKVVAVKGIPKEEILDRRITAETIGIMERREIYAYNADGGSPCFPVEGINRYAVAAAPVIASGDIAGAILFLSADDAPSASASDKEIALVQAGAAYLGDLLSD